MKNLGETLLRSSEPAKDGRIMNVARHRVPHAARIREFHLLVSRASGKCSPMEIDNQAGARAAAQCSRQSQPRTGRMLKALRLPATLLLALAGALLAPNSAADTLTFQQGVGGYTGLKQTTLFQLGAGASAVNGGLSVGTWTVDGGNLAYNNGEFKHGLIWFDNIFGSNPGQIPFGSLITSATITATYNDFSDSAFAVHRMLQTWSPATATWNSFTAGVQADGIEAAAAATTTFSNPNSGGAGTYNAYGTSLTDDLQLFSSGTPNYGWVVLPTSGFSGWGWSAAQTNSAVLSVTFTPPGALPAATINSPTNGATVGQSFTITATATAVPPATVASVTFKDGATVLGVDTTSPYSWNVTGAALGSHTLTAVVTDSSSSGATATSAPVNVTVVNLLPTVSITSPATGTKVPTTFTINANATDPDGTVSSVAFYDGPTLLGTDTTSPFTWNVVGAAEGSHALTAVATDNNSASTTSATVNVTVAVPIPIGPTGSGTLTFDTLAAANQWATRSVAGGAGEVVDDAGLDSVMNGIAAANINTALGSQTGSGSAPNAYWRSGDKKLGTQPTLNKVTLLMAPLQNASGGILNTLAVSYTLGLASVTPTEWIKGHRVYWSKTGAAGSWTAAGNYLLSTPGSTASISIYLTALNWADGGSLYLVWADDNGMSTEGDYTIDNVSFTPFSGPVVSITSPANGAMIGTDFTINAIAATGSGTISSVSFYDGAVLLGTDDSSPYSYTWNAAPAGSHTLTAVATDSNSGTATSSAIGVTVASGSGALTRGPYLQMAAPTTMTIRWRSTQSTLGRVRFGTDIADLNQTADESAIPAAPFDHVVTLTGLTPNTTYFYSVGSATDTLASGANYTFKTPPAAGTPVNTRIWVLGDAGTSGNSTLPEDVNQIAVRDAFYTWTGARTPSLVLQLGDNAYNSGTDGEFQKGVFNIYPTMLSKTPFWSCLGNHETDGASVNSTAYPYFDIYSLPMAGESGGVASGTEHYYSFDYGNIHFIALDSMISSRAVDNPATAGINEDGPMAAWLRTDLASTTATWIICFFHHPTYSKGSHDSDSSTDSGGRMVQMRQNFLPILEAGGVDLVLSGHSHSYERSYLLDGHYGLSSTLVPAMKKNAGDGRPTGNGAYIKPLTGPRDHFGAVYAVAGSSGKISGVSLHPAHCIFLNNLGSLVLDVDGTRLDATFVRENGTTPDTFTMIKQGAADSDADGIPDEYELANGLNRLNAADAALDADGDDQSNLSEYIAGTDPNNPNSKFTASIAASNGVMILSFTAQANKTYSVQYKNSLTDAEWITLQSYPAAPAQGTIDYTEPAPLPNARFYRVVTP